MPPTAAEVMNLVLAELTRAQSIHGPFASAHEGLAVIEEEFDELKLATYWGVDHRGNPADPIDEAIQLAAMSIRFVIDTEK